MPFAYFGSKHGLARKYLPPGFGRIVEPFGAAGYSAFWATPAHTVELYDKDPFVVGLWRDLLTDWRAVVEEGDREAQKDHTTFPLLKMARGGASLARITDVISVNVNDWLRVEWRNIRRRIVKTAPCWEVGRWTIEQADYRDLPNKTATWFVDPPYQPHDTAAGLVYREGADGIDYAHLAEWCRSRTGQKIVCEQQPAEWLPFRPLARQNAQATRSTGRGSQSRVEVVWTQTPGHVLATPRSRTQRDRALTRRRA